MKKFLSVIIFIILFSSSIYANKVTKSISSIKTSVGKLLKVFNTIKHRKEINFENLIPITESIATIENNKKSSSGYKFNSKLYLYVKKARFGPFELTGAGKDGKLGTKDDGPLLDFEISDAKFSFKIYGAIDIFGKIQSVILNINQTGFDFNYHEKRFLVFHKDIYGKFNVNNKNPDVNLDVSCYLSENYRKDFNKFINKDLTNALNNVNKELDKARAEIAKTKKELSNIDKEIKKKTAKIVKARKPAYNNFKKLEKYNKNTWAYIKKKERERDKLGFWDLKRVPLNAEIGFNYTKLGTLKASLATAKFTLSKIAPPESDPQIIAWKAEKEIKKLGLNIANESLKGIQETNKNIIKAGKSLLNAFVLDKIHFNTSFKNIKKQKPITLYVKYSLNNKSKTIKLQTNFRNDKEAYEQVKKTIGQQISPNVLSAYRISESKLYKIESLNSKKVLDVGGVSLLHNAQILQWPFKNGNNQKWKFSYSGRHAGYFFIMAKHSSKVIGIKDRSKNNHANVVQQSFTGADNQLWKIQKHSNGVFALINKHSGKCIDIKSRSKKDGAHAIQYKYFKTPNQLWKFYQVN